MAMYTTVMFMIVDVMRTVSNIIVQRGAYSILTWLSSCLTYCLYSVAVTYYIYL